MSTRNDASKTRRDFLRISAASALTAGIASASIQNALAATTAGEASKAGYTPVQQAGWMGALPDSLSLSEITIPGAHDAGTRGIVAIAQCQSMTLFEQLDAGIRYLDIRCKVVDGSLRIYHGIVPTNLTFNSDVRDVFMGFLDLNPTESIVMLVSNESGLGHQEFERLFRASIQAYSDKWYLGNTVPKLGDVRGKIILVRRFPVASPAEPFGIDGTVWLDNQTFEISNTAKFSIQDQYVIPTFADIDHKWEHIEELLEKTAGGTGGRWFINYCSGTGAGTFPVSVLAVEGCIPDKNEQREPYPHSVAKGGENVVGENDRLLNYIHHLDKRRVLGTIVLDFPEYPNNLQLVDSLIALNFDGKHV